MPLNTRLFTPGGAPGPAGPQGEPGPAGTSGTDGNTILYGPVAPTGGDGTDGDFYIDTQTYKIYGPKASGTWPAGVELQSTKAFSSYRKYTAAGGESALICSDLNLDNDKIYLVRYNINFQGSSGSTTVFATYNSDTSQTGYAREGANNGATYVANNDSRLDQNTLSSGNIRSGMGFLFHGIQSTAGGSQKYPGFTYSLYGNALSPQGTIYKGLGTDNVTQFALRISGSLTFGDGSELEIYQLSIAGILDQVHTVQADTSRVDFDYDYATLGPCRIVGSIVSDGGSSGEFDVLFNGDTNNTGYYGRVISNNNSAPDPDASTLPLATYSYVGNDSSGFNGVIQIVNGNAVYSGDWIDAGSTPSSAQAGMSTAWKPSTPTISQISVKAAYGTNEIKAGSKFYLSPIAKSYAARGNTILNGSASPSATDGRVGDFYLKTSTYQLYGPKTASGWGSPVTIGDVQYTGKPIQVVQTTYRAESSPGAGTIPVDNTKPQKTSEVPLFSGLQTTITPLNADSELEITITVNVYITTFTGVGFCLFTSGGNDAIDAWNWVTPAAGWYGQLTFQTTYQCSSTDPITFQFGSAGLGGSVGLTFNSGGSSLYNGVSGPSKMTIIERKA